MTRTPDLGDLIAHLNHPATPAPEGTVMTITVPARHLPARTTTELLAAARAGITEAHATAVPGLRYAAAHLAALRAAAAVIADRATPVSGRPTRLPSVWELLPHVAPELSEWADHYTTTATTRAAAEAGIPHTVTANEADDAVREAEHFIACAEMATR